MLFFISMDAATNNMQKWNYWFEFKNLELEKNIKRDIRKEEKLIWIYDWQKTRIILNHLAVNTKLQIITYSWQFFGRE